MKQIHQMKTFSENELRQIAGQEGYLDTYPSIFAVSDGSFFPPESSRYARDWAARRGLQVYELKQDGSAQAVEAQAATAPLSASAPAGADDILDTGLFPIHETDEDEEDDL